MLHYIVIVQMVCTGDSEKARFPNVSLRIESYFRAVIWTSCITVLVYGCNDDNGDLYKAMSGIGLGISLFSHVPMRYHVHKCLNVMPRKPMQRQYAVIFQRYTRNHQWYEY
eukprot:PhF_6_TR5153/c2_g2_i1/m.7368